ncbi:MAG: hypothetical protein J0L57_20980 [Burkholderiales bacterium]|nr:hypothetical protein [Burkholderiales bacterium]
MTSEGFEHRLGVALALYLSLRDRGYYFWCGWATHWRRPDARIAVAIWRAVRADWRLTLAPAARTIRPRTDALLRSFSREYAELAEQARAASLAALRQG